MNLDIVISFLDLLMCIFKCGLNFYLIIIEFSIYILNIIDGWSGAHYNVLSHNFNFINHLNAHLVNILFTTSFLKLRNWLILWIICWDAKICFVLRLVLIRLICLWSWIWTSDFIVNSWYSTACHRCYTTTKCLGSIENTSTLSRLILIEYILVHVWSSLGVCYACLNIT